MTMVSMICCKTYEILDFSIKVNDNFNANTENINRTTLPELSSSSENPLTPTTNTM